MQKNGLITAFLFICLVLTSLPLSGQSSSALLDIYNDGDIDKLRSLKTQGRISDPGWPVFIDALFISDAEEAIRRMYNAYALTGDKGLKKAIRERISLYYASRGYYISARRIVEEEDYFVKMMALKGGEMLEQAALQDRAQQINDAGAGDQDDARGLRLSEALAPGRFGVQVGAFGTQDNAESLMKRYRQEYPNAKVVQKRRDNRTFYLVVIGEYRNRAQAQSSALQINEKLNVKGYVVEY